MTTSPPPVCPQEEGPNEGLNLSDKSCHLTNGDVKLALLGHYQSKDRLLAFLAAEDLLGSKSRPFGFDLVPIVRIRQAISQVVGPRMEPKPGGRREVLDSFRQELIFVTAAAASDSSLDLAMQLYLALMALHDREAEDPAHLPDDATSVAGEYLMRCLAVQASYSQFKTYRSLLLQFLKVVHTIKVPSALAMTIERRFIEANSTSRETLQAQLAEHHTLHLRRRAMYEEESAGKPEDVNPIYVDAVVVVGEGANGPSSVTKVDRSPPSAGGSTRLFLLAGASDDDIDAVALRVGADPRKGAKVVRLVDGAAPGWAPSRQGLKLILPTKRGPSVADLVHAWCVERGGAPNDPQTAGARDRWAALDSALSRAQWNLLSIFEELLHTAELCETHAGGGSPDAPRGGRRGHYDRLYEALTLLPPFSV